nr:DUF2945 domain-containing protein [Polymorphobacter multimanifer]
MKAGDAVEWESSGGHSTGKVVKKIIRETKLKGHVAKASPDEPQFKVKSETGGEAIHRPEALKKV